MAQTIDLGRVVGEGASGITIGDQTFSPDDAGYIDMSDMIAPDAAKLGGKAPEYYLSPRNLLDNSYWMSPGAIVNQRGYTSGSNIGAWSYCIDRWVEFGGNSASITFEADGALLNGVVAQKIPTSSFVSGDKYTYALYFTDGTALCASGTVITGVTEWQTIAGEASGNIHLLLFSDNAESVGVRCTDIGSKRIFGQALYHGEYTADTLPPYVPKGYAAELAECRRFFQPKCTVLGRAINLGYIAISYNFSPPMRIAPSCMAESVQLNGINNSIYSGDMYCAGNNSHVYQCSGGGDIYTTGEFYQIVFNANADL